MEIYTKKMKKPTSILYNVKMFVLCHGLLQLTQLMYSSYFKSTITTIERRFGLSSYSSGTISSLHEVGNTVLIVFVSYFGSRVHRPRFIGVGGLLMSISAMMLTLPHFLSDDYVYNSVLHDRHDICNPQMNSSATGGSCGIDETKRLADDKTNLWLLMTSAQLLFGVGSVPIQPFGISYIDDFAGPNNSPLYIAILFAVSTFGPAFGFLMGAAVLKIYVDVDRTGSVSHEELIPSDPRWVGAWWMGLVISSVCLAITSIPYFFFPRNMPQEFVTVTEADLNEDPKKTDATLLDFLRAFPRLFARLLLSPLFLILVLAQCCFSSVIAGLATFLNAFLERQYSSSASYSSMLMGAVNLPCVALGMLTGGVIMKKVGLSLKTIPRFSVVMLVLSTLLVIPLFFMGCPTQKVAEVNYRQHGSVAACYSNCSCPDGAFNPVCGSDGIEYVSPCHAGCTDFTRDPNNTYRVQSYTNCRCISDGQHSARPGPCANSCPHYLLPVMLILSAAGLIASLTHNPLYMMVLRIVPFEEKSFAIGVQFLLMRLLAWLPAPAFFGMAIDTSCIRWKEVCGKRSSCGYYDNNILRNRYLGLQVGYKVTGIGLLMLLGWKVQRTNQYSLEKRPDGPL